MTRLAAVTFRNLGKIHYYPAEGLSLEVGTYVIAETAQGLEYGQVKILRDVEGASDDGAQSFRLLRVATADDAAIVARRKKQADEGLLLCQGQADALGLPMKVMDAEVSFDASQVTFYFCAESRIDFRALVKEVAARMRIRIHLHQVGSRDHAKALGGYGPCGRPLCCTTFLREFAPVSMKMAKDQSLFLNPSKFSGVCGKLMCCLRYEHDLYLDARDRLPPVGGSVACPDGSHGFITDVNALKETVAVLIQDEETSRTVTYRASEVTIARACGDCGSAGGGCGGSCGSGGCGTAAKAAPIAAVISLERRRKNGES